MVALETLHQIRDGLAADGYCLLGGLRDVPLLDLAASLGKVTVDPRNPYPLRVISPQDLAVANINTLSSRYGLGPFPFHTDVAHWRSPARLVLLMCVNRGSSRRPTYITDSRAWDLPGSVWTLLRSAVWRTGHLRPFLCVVAERRNDRLEIRYDPGCMSPRSASAERANRLITDYMLQLSPVRIDWTPGDVLILDNHRVLHARGAASRPDQDRKIARVLVGGSYESLGS